MPFGLYVHFPFCRNKCSYCDFYKELYDVDLETKFFKALMIETELAAEAHGSTDREISTIFIGGGTPSLVNLGKFEEWLGLIRRLFIMPQGIEFSVENNPDSINVENLKAFKELGVNRPTYGIQSFNPKLLKLLNRKHNPEHSQKAVYLTNALGYTNFGVDMIFGLPRQTTRMLSADLDQIIDLEPPHISFYQLTVETGTTLAERVKAGSLVMPSQEVTMSLYRGGCERMAEAGYHRYEVSSFAKPGFECKHNLGYWVGDDYLGLGPSAHSFMNGERFANVPSVTKYIGSLLKRERPVIRDESGEEERMEEAIMLGLRMSRGIDRHQFALRFGQPIEDRLDLKQYELFINSGHLITEGETLRLSDEGILLADEITRRLTK
ncbi:MAG: radical SAM family heme chaperone HemW [Candidatus Zixiibacteriota bacterium]